jgi:hypothetical protein
MIMIATNISITITLIVETPGRYQAEVDGKLLVPSSSTPFLDGARELIAKGYSPYAILEARRPGQSNWDLRAQLGVAAALDVRETANGPIFRAFVASQSLLASPPIAATDDVGTQTYIGEVH